MINRIRAGIRVKIKPGVVTFYRRFKGNETGVIVSELDNNLGQTLVDVEWDGVGQSPVFEHEIEILPPMLTENTQ